MIILEIALFVAIGVVFSGPIKKIYNKVVGFVEDESKKI
jgi:hypothetical protein